MEEEERMKGQKQWRHHRRKKREGGGRFEMWPEGVEEKKQEKDSLSSVDGDKLSVDWK